MDDDTKIGGRALHLAAFFGPEGAASRIAPGYRMRPQQLELAEFFMGALEIAPYPLAAEAPCGSGKTLAYLSTVTAAVAEGQKVTITTSNKALQDVLARRLLPTLLSELDKSDVTVAALKGGANYVCLRKLPQTAAVAPRLRQQRDTPAERTEKALIAGWGGEREDAPEDLRDARVWSRIAWDSSMHCGRCSLASQCPKERAKQAALSAQITVANHHSFILNDRKEDLIVVDEAHELASAAQSALSKTFARYMLPDDMTPSFDSIVAAFHGSFDLTAATFRGLVPQGGDGSSPGAIVEVLNQLTASADRRDDWKGSEAQVAKLQELRNCVSMYLSIRFLVNAENDRGHKELVFAPIRVENELRLRLVGRSVILTSATMRAASLSSNSWHYTLAELGQDAALATTLVVDSPFDYAKNALLIVPTNLPDPSQFGHTDAVVYLAHEVFAQIGHRGVLMLFTSNTAKNRAANMLQTTRPVFVQNELSNRAKLVQDFAKAGNGVLLGVSSFWTGVDVPGDACAVVMIDKLPFAPLDSVSARSAAAKHGNASFSLSSLPEMSIKLRQGVGRLLRSETDRGVVVICDPRIVTTAYGQKTLSTLPKMQSSRSIHDIKRFLEQV